ncbi:MULTISPECIES: hypothetical protein [unclassified Streptomyces]|uniref:hypothetical protein n=1 Tax=unclassified Streptomyces TaxID=2593676 RepID=UPI002E34D48D|nr:MULTISPECIES: hypothetical protein [unclassified Streptomyces]WUC63595.1 hypothetical protein OG861_04800 [Streptomyces sp. NBC_00539]
MGLGRTGLGHDPGQATSRTAPATTGSGAVSAAWRRRALLPPLLWAVSAGLLVARTAFDSDTFRNCRYLGPSPRMYVTSWGGLACVLGSLLAYAVLRRTAHRFGPAAWSTWQGRCATVSALLAPLFLLALLMTTYWLYAPDPSGGYDCSGLHRLTGP